MLSISLIFYTKVVIKSHLAKEMMLKDVHFIK